MRRLILPCVLVVAPIVGMTAYSSGSSRSSIGSPSNTPAMSHSGATPSAAQSRSCAPGGGGSFLGTYSTSAFHPKLTYTATAGWQNFDDSPGTFLLVPPGAPVPGNTINTGFITAATSVAAETGCLAHQAQRVGTSLTSTRHARRWLG
jgi:hypothetical protein